MNYMLIFIVYIEEATAMRFSIPIVIGTVPLEQPSTTQISAAGAFPQPSAPLQTPSVPVQPTAPPLSALRWKPPPSYQECIGMTSGNIRDADDNQEVCDDMTYRPVYPMYPTIPASQEIQKTSS
ncbi:unnamed protein product [Soboliphyme baturini]|uniref:Secreted protein n=1 Tax=Soboliphyme baturini TaxID=241478 RepID=A0A183J585_9BILA|nr:unnamed protein product [Soboliphyme baturini]